MSLDESFKLAEALKRKLAEMNINITGKGVKRYSNSKNNHYRRKSDDPLPYHKSIEGKHSQQQSYKKRNSSGFDVNEANQQNMIKTSSFGSNK